MATQAAASMAVNVGHFDDPEDREGMAHFLEHMLFLGTQKYPLSGEYHAFINQHGGSNNAWTGTEHTNYFFSISADVFEEALDRFSQFFIAPLFTADLVDRERQAIESEYSLKLKDDIRRVYQVQKETANQAHPFAKFSVGNLKTLSGEQHQLREELITFYNQNYSANLMTLCVVAPIELSKTQAMIEAYFGNIKNQDIEKSYHDTPLFTPNELGKQINIVPLKEQKRLSLNFHLPAVERLYRHKPLTFISHLLGNEGPGSLLSYLKLRGLANNMSAGGGVSGYNFKDYAITFQLTDKGLANVDTIVLATFEYIELIRTQGLESWRYQERANLLNIAFKYQEQIKSLDLVSHLSINMHHYPAADLVVGDYRMDGLDIEETQQLLALMNAQNMRLQIVAQDLDTERTADWYHTPYHIENFTKKQLQAWQVNGVRAELTLPTKNPFIIEDAQTRSEPNVAAKPLIIHQQPGFTLWHKKDDHFNVPKGHLYLSVDSQVACKTPLQAAMTKLYIELLSDYLNEHTYQAEIAGLHYSIYSHQGGLTLHLSGYTGKQESLLALLFQKGRERAFTEKRFTQIKNQLIRNWINTTQTKPISQLFTSLTVTLQKYSYEPKRLADCLEDVTLEDLNSHIDDFYEHTHVEGFVYGDWLSTEAKSLATSVQATLSKVSQPSTESTRELINLTGCKTLFRELEVAHQDSAIIVYYQSTTSTPENMALFSLLNHTMSSTFFNELRTKRQLGYMVGTGYLPLNRHPGMIFYVQSPSAGPLQLLEAIDEFIADFNYAVLQITNEQWETTKLGLIQQILESDSNLKTRSQRYWISIGNKDHQFNQRENVVEQIKQLTRADLIRFMVASMRSKNSDRLVLYNTGEQHKQQTQLNTRHVLTDLRAFKKNSKKFQL
ncbi:peptidase M16 [Shewanella gelidii]|uniref:Protease 3 n=2 Tax=Shewanella gelidii TaxID=1642821 RepID=A0A917JS20_9GAMM|nr:peptidase M16 [Shewanella gelidii]